MSKVKYILPFDEYGEIDCDLAEQAYSIAKLSSIRILSDKELSWMAVSRGKVVGAIFTSLVSGHFGFDTVVAEKWQKKGIGTKLIELGLDEYTNLSWDCPDIKLILEVVNPVAQKMLAKHGLRIIERVSNDIVIMGV